MAQSAPSGFDFAGPPAGTQVSGDTRHAATPPDNAQQLTNPDQIRTIVAEMLQQGNPERQQASAPDAATRAAAQQHTAQANTAADAIRDMVDAKFRQLGLTNVDRRHLAFPEVTDPNGSGSQENPRLRNWMFSQQRGAGSADEFDHAKADAMSQWFRFVLFGRMPTDALVTRALSEGTDSEGGYTVPPGFIAEIIHDAEKLSALYQWVRRIPVRTMGGEIPTVTTNAGVSWGSENTAFDESDPAFGTATYTIKRLNALVKISREVANDSNPNIVDFVTMLFREKIVEERDRVVAVGNGTTEPLGLYSATGITDVASITTLTYDNLVTLHETVDHRYFDMPNCRWQFNQNVKAAVMKIKDLEGLPIFLQDKAEGFRPRIFGHPVSIENALPDNYIGFGDLRFYLVFDRETLGVERSTEAGTAFATHQLWIKFWERWDGKPVLPPTAPLARSRVLSLS